MVLTPEQLLDDEFYKTVMWENEKFLPFAYGHWFKRKKGWNGGMQMRVYDLVTEVPSQFRPVRLVTGKFYAVAAPYHGQVIRHRASAEDPAEELASFCSVVSSVLETA